MSERIRVAQIITRFIAGAGGITLRGSLALDPTQYHVTILSSDGGPLLRQAEEAGLEVIRLRHMHPELNPLHDFQGLRELSSVLGRSGFDVVHTHSSKAGVLGRITAHRIGIPAVHTFHGFPFHEFQSWPRRAIYIAIERRLGRITSEFLAEGSGVAAQAVRLRIAPPERIRVVASAIGSNIKAASPESRARARALMKLPQDARIIGTVGRLDYQKAPEDMVRAISSLTHPDVYCVWIGDGPLSKGVMRLIRRNGLSSRFVLLGERSDVPDLLPGFDIFAMSSRYEGLPCSIVEAMTCGLPVVATAVNSVPDVVIAGRTGLLVPPAAPRLLAQAVAHLLDHPEQAAEMALAARLHVSERFRPELLAKDMAESYARALKHKTAPAISSEGVVGLSGR